MAGTTRREVLIAIGMATTGISATMASHAAADDVERPVEMHDGEHTIIAHDCAHFEYRGPGARSLDVTVSHYLDGELTQSWLTLSVGEGPQEFFLNCYAEVMRDTYGLWDGQGSIVIEHIGVYDMLDGYVAHFEWPEQFRCHEVVHDDIHPWVEEEICSEYSAMPDVIGEGEAPINDH